MNIKDSIGLRIKTERERQQMSREVLCLDGAELTVRQLIRIEKGESLPSLDRLSYIAKRLGNILSFTSWEESPKVEEIYEDLFEQVKRKKKFSTNDLLVIDYYFFHLYGRKQYDKKLFEKIVKRVLNQEIWTDDVHNIVLFNDLMAIAALKIFHNSFSDFLTVVDKALAVIEKSQFYSYKPSVFVLKAKYELLHKGNKKKAAENYDKAIMFASVLEDSVLEESIKAGKAADGL